MIRQEIVAPSYRQLRPVKAAPPSDAAAQPLRPRFPVYPDLAATLADATAHPDKKRVVAHVLATLSAYSYSDADTVATIATRLGLEKNRCLRIGQDVDALFIRSTAYLLQSSDRSVSILCYRGTEPVNPVSWLTDADVSPAKMSFQAPGGAEAFSVHAGFYRNVRSTEVDVVAALRRALAGKSILERDGDEKKGELKALYLAGHSLGGAMAAMMATMLVMDGDYADIAPKLRAVYTYGQPMIGDSKLAKRCAGHPFLGSHLIRYIWHKDVVPELPPAGTGDFAHFGQEWRCLPPDETWKRSAKPTTQLRYSLELVGAVTALVAQMFSLWRGLPYPHSLYDHEPQHYLAALTPDGVHGEFG